MYAQTNIQLWNQMLQVGYEPSDIAFTARCYELAMRLFAGRFRISGKTFMAHLVGTASILASLRAPIRLVAAALVHAAYQSGDFGASSDRRQQILREATSPEVERLAADYHALQWDHTTIPALHAEVAHLAASGRDALLLRLANELEEYLDLGVLYGGVPRHRLLDYRARYGDLLIDMALQLGYPALGTALQTALEQAVAAPPIDAGWRLTDQHAASFVVVPAAYQALADTLSQRLQQMEVTP